MKIKESPKPQGPAHKFEGGSGRTRCLMEPHINLKEGQGDSETFMDPYISLQEGQRDQETSWTRTSMSRRVKKAPKPHEPVHKFEGGPMGPWNLIDLYINLKEVPGDPEISWTRT